MKDEACTVSTAMEEDAIPKAMLESYWRLGEEFKKHDLSSPAPLHDALKSPPRDPLWGDPMLADDASHIALLHTGALGLLLHMAADGFVRPALVLFRLYIELVSRVFTEAAERKTAAASTQPGRAH